MEVPKIVQVVDQMDEHPKVKKSKLSQEDEIKLHFKCEQMNQEYRVPADKAEEREQLLKKTIAQIHEDLERLDAENHHLLDANKHLNEEKLKVEPMMKAMLEKMVDGFADAMAEKSAKFMQIIKEMEAKADVDKTKMQELQNEVNGLRKYHSRFNYRSREDDLLIMKWEN